jgi:hypothetical protein
MPDNDSIFLRNFRALRLPILGPDGTSTWPEMFPADAIEALRENVGLRHFSAQMMLEYIAEDRIRLNPESLRFYDEEIDWRTTKLIPHSTLHIPHLITGTACYWDPSSARYGADSSVVTLILRDDKTRSAFIHDLQYLKTDDDLHPFKSQCAAVLDFLKRHNMRHLGLETNGIGNAMPEILRDVAARRGAAIVVQRVVNHEKKERRILNAIEPLLGTGRLFAHERIRRTPLLDEMADWIASGPNARDDGLDAIAGALRLQPIALRPRGQQVQTLSAKTEFSV